MGLTDEQKVSKIKNLINEIDGVSQLRDIREFADLHVQLAKEAEALANSAELEAKYRGKYLIMYGRHVSMMMSTQNKNDIRIVHVLDIKFKGHGFFRCHARVIHIKFNDEWKQISHLTSDWGSSYISYTDDKQYDIHENDIDEIVDKGRAEELVRRAKEDYMKIANRWDDFCADDVEE